MCQKNVGRLDAFLRITAGTVAVSVGIMRDRPSLAMLGACKIASGVTRYCPVYDLLNVHTVSDEEILEEMNLSFDDDDDEYEPHKCCGGHHHHEEDGATEYQGRRHYTHRAIKRNQFANRQIL